MKRFAALFVAGTAVLAVGSIQDWHTPIALGGYVLGLAFARLPARRPEPSR